MKTAEIRQSFLDYFASKQHEVVASSSLIPGNDPTLMFTNAGMNQFKDVFLGQDNRSYTRATSSQRCVRAGGKHNDLENVGYTARHHTFFEMLGNFSFGDYFKQDAIKYAWEFLTSKEWLGLPEEKLLVTVYADDDEAYDIWHKEMGLPADKIIRIGDNKGEKFASDNFWQMGDTGPCGPCTEIFYDHGEHIWGGKPGTPEEDGDRFIEIWNNVFMQFNRQADGTMEPLPKPSVDTGMGLERISAIMQGVHANYEIDLFQGLIKAAAEVTGTKDLDSKSLLVIADHIRSCSFLISDGVMPSNEGRGYVLRRIIRRALRHGHILGATDLFFYKLVAALVKEMGEAYPELAKNQAHIEKILKLEEEQFAKTLDHGMKLLESAIADLKGDTIAGETVFKLYDTYGFPVDLTADIARERNLKVDEAGFDACMAEQKNKARAASNFKVDYTDTLNLEGETDFTGYDSLLNQGKIIALFKDGAQVETLTAGDEGMVVLDSTPFYGESGGQVGDKGLLSGNGIEFIVTDTTKEQKNHLHHGEVKVGTLKVGDSLSACVDEHKRQQTALHHSATHLLHAALREALGEHVQQKGSLCTYDRLRFDFAHFEAMTADELSAVEKKVNAQIRVNTPVTTELMDIEAAKANGAMALFGEKYDDEVRVLSMGSDNFSVELCGGTHAKRTGDIGFLKIVSESGIAAGVRRVEAVVAEAAYDYIANMENTISSIASQVKANRETVLDKVEAAINKSRQLEKDVQQLKAKLASGAGTDLAAGAKQINGVNVLAAQLDGADVPAMRGAMDQLKNKLGSGVILLASNEGEKVTLIAGVTKDLLGKAKAGDIVKELAPYVDGRGGGKPDLAQAGGKKPEGIPEALAAFEQWAQANL
ncbi:alanine--tRNA ligase [Bermanella sp. WJH001]|uniref:alanine--tRNA ligase n=1 Tax=Bermanella sp. WJH001 TaxID=3048005 RepID=UPI0024BE3BC1|nr:alanine--tRNA ligase [Bermanella sp. WJH001]MDJ1539723.1 alanine--tRNA ligase [Bermanella sp. WJH001]